MICIIGLTTRCGSSNFARLIHYNMKYSQNFLLEPFHVNYNGWGMCQKDKPKKQTISTIAKTVEDYDVTLIKTLEHHLSEGDNKKLIELSSKVIVLYRKNYFDSYVSEWMSHSYMLQSGKSLYGTTEIKQDDNFFKQKRLPINIGYLLNNYKNKKQKLENFKNNKNVDYIIDYDSFFYSQQNHVDTLTNLCDILNIELKTVLDLDLLHHSNKCNSFDFYGKLIPNWKEALDLRASLEL